MDEAVDGAVSARAGGHPRSWPVTQRRLDRALIVVVAVGLGLWIATWLLILANPEFFGRFYGDDLQLYLEATERWLAGGGFYNSYQLMGPYPLTHGDVLYPPTALLLFLPFTVLPSLLWWILPAALVTAAIARLRPAPWALVVMVGCLWWPFTLRALIWGNPVMWVAAAVALGTWRPFFAPFAMIKFTLAPAALMNIQRRAWWAGVAVLVAISLAFLQMWPDYLSAIRNLETANPFVYSIQEVPLVAIPWIAWLARRRG